MSSSEQSDRSFPLGVALFHECGLRKLRISLQSLIADSVPPGSVYVIAKMRAADVEALVQRYGANFLLLHDCSSNPIQDSHVLGWSWLRAGDVWLKGKAAYVVNWIQNSDTDCLTHNYFPATPRDWRLKLCVRRESRQPEEECPTSCLSFRRSRFSLASAVAGFPKAAHSTSGMSVQHCDLAFVAIADSRPRARFQQYLPENIVRRTVGAGRLSGFHDCYRGRRAFVIGNGPSLAAMDLRALAGELTFASNGFFQYFDRIDWRPSVYTCIDTVVLPSLSKDLGNLVGRFPETRFFFPRYVEDDDLFAVRWWVPSLIPPAPNTVYFADHGVREGKSSGGYKLHPRHSLVRPATVTLTLLQLAILMGCDPIYLIGCDNSYTIPENASLQEPARAGAVTRIVLPDDSDPNHFLPTYFGKDKPWHVPNTGKMTEDYRRFRREMDPFGKRVFNAGVGGALEEFPRVAFESLFQKPHTPAGAEVVPTNWTGG